MDTTHLRKHMSRQNTDTDELDGSTHTSKTKWPSWMHKVGIGPSGVMPHTMDEDYEINDKDNPQ